jgi:hypothetical protein
MNSTYFILEIMGATRVNSQYAIYLKHSRFILNIPAGFKDKDVINYLGFQTFNSKSYSYTIRRDIARLTQAILDIQKNTTILPFLKV